METPGIYVVCRGGVQEGRECRNVIRKQEMFERHGEGNGNPYWRKEPGGLQFMELQGVGHDLASAVLSHSVVSDSLQPHDCSLSDSFVHGDSPGKNTGGGCHALLQGIFSTQGLNPGLPHCSRILYHLSHKGSPAIHINSCS